VAEGQLCCPDCGAEYAPFGEERSEQVDWVVRIVRVVHRRRRYRRTCGCRAPELVVAPVPPKPIPKGLFTSMFLARLLVDEYVLGRPLTRVVSALSNDGCDVGPGTLVGALKAVSVRYPEQWTAASRLMPSTSTGCNVVRDETNSG
jgi:transposase